jgi:hypothetical protein
MGTLSEIIEAAKDGKMPSYWYPKIEEDIEYDYDQIQRKNVRE